MSVTGHVHSIESCGTVDGPGIRFIVFLQGCLMRCKYCHNRDSWDIKTGTIMSSDEIVSELLQYRHYMAASGGGVTLSGGEAMLQPEFVKDIFTKAKAEGIHTCLDTNGFIRKMEPLIDEVLDVTDLVLLDIKQMDDSKHIDLTRVSNKYTLRFAQHLAQRNQPVYLRYVVLPSYTDADEDVNALGKFIEPMKNIEKIELLPYHELGKHKWLEMGETYPLEGIHPPTPETMARVKDILSRYHGDIVY
ncbi:pyruvate formate lyase 1-activating protein [Reinekea thalattae]|uniref:Pyruvate formate-lyase-activating enzyme n=1 Tax=Reinekea thalattae TaxID=2593301 RepID=A0A5C8ZAE8_9GAMM|nr:pyruvate formate lyase 1-activating protein [Reinekea thalattae]TXR53856.1 pyruvate formate lyase 1-activating protein [Reinekea thalattae]